MKHLALILILLPALCLAGDFEAWSNLSRGLSEGREILSHDLESLPNGMPCEGAIISGFGYRLHPIFRVVRHHDGIDIVNERGTEIHATGGGTVIFAGRKKGYGKIVIVQHSPRITTRYAHLDSFTVGVGDEVKRGDLIGLVGNTGITTGPHLHYEIRIDGVAVDPKSWL